MSSEAASKFIATWQQNHEGKEFVFTDPVDQEMFLKASDSLMRFLSHTANKISIHTVLNGQSVSSIFFKVSQ